MDSKQKNSYKSSKWYSLRASILQRDNFCCAQCHRQFSSDKLHVHHLHYIEGRKAWEYQENELITLCRGCHAQEHEITRPKFGWDYEGMEDLGDMIATCDFCDNSIRYVHYISHKNWGYMAVGCQCADKLTQTSIASEKEKELKSYTKKLKTFIDSNRWKPIKGGHSKMIYNRQFSIIIWNNFDHYRIHVHYSITDEWGMPISGEIKGSKKFKTLEEAKTKVFESITNGKLKSYIKRHTHED